MSNAEKFLQLQEEMMKYRKAFGEAADRIVDQELSNYPIFVVHQHEVELGVPIIDKDKTNGLWSVNASTMEEFTYKGIIKNEKVENFKKVFKPPSDSFCLFVLSELGAQFIFLPRVDEA